MYRIIVSHELCLTTITFVLALMCSSYSIAQFDYFDSTINDSEFFKGNYKIQIHFRAHVNSDEIADDLFFVQTFEGGNYEYHLSLLVVINSKNGSKTYLNPFKLQTDAIDPLTFYDITELGHGELILYARNYNSKYDGNFDCSIFREIKLTYLEETKDFKILRDGGTRVLLPENSELYVEQNDLKDVHLSKILDLNYVLNYRKLFYKKQAIIKVDNLEDFLKAVGHNTIIEITSEKIDFSNAKLSTFSELIDASEYLSFENIQNDFYSAMGLTIKNVYNLTIRSTDLKRISNASSGLACFNVLSSQDVNFEKLNIISSGFAFRFNAVVGVNIKDCDLTILKGRILTAKQTDEVTISNCTSDYSKYYALNLEKCKKVTFHKVKFHQCDNCFHAMHAIFSDVRFVECGFDHSFLFFEPNRVVSSHDSKIEFDNCNFPNIDLVDYPDHYCQQKEIIEKKKITYENLSNYDYTRSSHGDIEYDAYEAYDYYELSEFGLKEEIRYVFIGNAEQVIRAYISAENERDWSSILELLSENVTNFWGVKNPEREIIKQSFERGWSLSTSSENKILELKSISNDNKTWHLKLEFSYSEFSQTKVKITTLAVKIDDSGRISDIFLVK